MPSAVMGMQSLCSGLRKITKCQAVGILGCFLTSRVKEGFPEEVMMKLISEIVIKTR